MNLVCACRSVKLYVVFGLLVIQTVCSNLERKEGGEKNEILIVRFDGSFWIKGRGIVVAYLVNIFQLNNSNRQVVLLSWVMINNINNPEPPPQQDSFHLFRLVIANGVLV